MRFLVLGLLAIGPLHAAIDGTVVNRTTGKSQPGVSITLIKPGQGGMRTIGTTVSDRAGHFIFEKDEPGGGPQLLQANYDGVNYNKLMTPNIPTSNVELDVFEATGSPTVARVTQQMLVLEPNSSQIAVSETVILDNQSNMTFRAESGEFRFYLPPAANGQVRVNAQGPQGMPLPRPAEKTDETDVFKIDFPIKPGETEFEISYILPAGSPFTFHGRVIEVKGMAAGPLRLIAPPGVTFSGKDIQNIGTEPKTQATIYNVTASDLFSFNITGTGSLHPQQDANTEDDADRPQVTEANPQIYSHLGWLLTFAFAILGLGLVLLFRSSPVRSPYGK